MLGIVGEKKGCQDGSQGTAQEQNAQG